MIISDKILLKPPTLSKKTATKDISLDNKIKSMDANLKYRMSTLITHLSTS